jgi:hypothetical protein
VLKISAKSNVVPSFCKHHHDHDNFTYRQTHIKIEKEDREKNNIKSCFELFLFLAAAVNFLILFLPSHPYSNFF